jgi:isoprenylcysteine carboxyl methyltransferase (ICMT) family protein YpbQ
MFGLWWVAVVFTLLNAALLRTRIRIENRALYVGQEGAGA